MKRRDLPFQDWGLKAIAKGRKTLTSRCSGLAAVNKDPDKWELLGRVPDGRWHFGLVDDHTFSILCSCPWQVGQVYPPANVRVTAIMPKRVQNMTTNELVAEGIDDLRKWLCAQSPKALLPEEWGDMESVFLCGWDSIHRRDVNNRYNRNPWRWELTFEVSP